MSGQALLLAAGKPPPGPVIPNFGKASSCVVNRSSHWCGGWVRDHWGDILQPALLKHIEMTVIAISIGFVIAFVAALAAQRFGVLEASFGLLAALVYTIPSLALFEILVPITGINLLTIEIALVGYTLLILFRNTLAGLRSVPDDVLEAAQGMGLTRTQILRRIELPLALPAIMAGLRIATVTIISLATIAAFLTPYGLGKPIFDGIQTQFDTEVLAAGGLAVILALGADALLVLAQRLVTPWTRARRQ